MPPEENSTLTTVKQAETPEPNPYVLPVSIIVSGALIAGAIMFSSSGGVGLPNLPAGNDSIVVGDTVANLTPIAKASGVDTEKFESCLSSGKYISFVQDQIQLAIDAGGRGTPYSVVIGKDGKKTVINGAQPIANVRVIVDKMLKGDASLIQTSPELDKVKPVTAKDHIQGDAKAPVKIVEYSDLDCPYCKQFHVTMNLVMEEYGKQGKVAWVFRHFPLEQLHPDAPRKAQASECVAELGGQQAFWTFVDRVSALK